jgi:ferric-dicitrate binding protein FerR (iron transport regulator)
MNSIDLKHQDRIQRALEGLLSAQEWQAFQEEVVRDPDLRAAYVEALWLHQSLRAGRFELEQTEKEPVVEMGPPRRGVALYAAALLAACAVFALGVYFFPRQQARVPTVATLVRAENCKWAGSDLPTLENSRLVAGTLALVEGMATIAFESGAVVTLEAPTKFQIRDAMHCRLIEGALTAEVPEPAHGFTIEAPDLKVIDLGTRFGLTASAVGNSQVRVFQGEVDVEGMPDGKVKRLKEGNGLHVHSGSTPAGQEPIQGQQVQEADGWVSIPTSFGGGKDGYARRGNEGKMFGLQPLLIVKHTELPDGRRNERRAVVSFDVSQISPTEVLETEFVLDPVPSGFGFSALVPDSRFAVYGIIDETLDSWNERDLVWDKTPACDDAGPLVSQTRRLAEFGIPRGGAGPTVTVRGDALGEFIRQDTNGIVSFIIVRETGETDPNGLAHGFASKEHPTSRPPTLRLRLPQRP